MTVLKKISGYIPAAFLIIAAAVNLYVRIRFINLPFNRDEGIWAYAAQSLFHGVPIYASILDTKLPGIIVIYWVFFVLFGQGIWQVRLSALIAVAVTSVYTYLLAGKLYNRRAALVSTAVFLTMSLTAAIEGLFAYTEYYVIMFLMAAFYHAFRSKDGNFTANSLLTGLFISLAVMTKQQVLPVAALAGVMFLVLAGKEKMIRALVLSGAAFAAPFAALFIYLLANHMVGNFIELVGKYEFMYSTFMDISGAPAALAFFTGAVKRWEWFFPALSALSYALILAKKGKSGGDIFLLFLLPVSFIAVSAGFMYRSHYFIFMLPAFAMLCGSVAAAAAFWPSLVAVTSMFLVSSFAVFQDRQQLFLNGHEAFLEANYGENPFYESLPIAKYIKEHTAPGDRVAILGSEPQIYFYSDRRAVSYYTVVYFMMWAGQRSGAMEREFIDAIMREKPKYLIFVNIDISWCIMPDSDLYIFHWYEKMKKERFTREGVMEMISPEKTVYVFGDKARDYKPTKRYTIEIWRTHFDDDKRVMPGSDRDSHGCIGSAGYTWCEKKHRCLRAWEEKCE